MSDCDPAEIAAYEVVRQRLRALAVKHPWLLEVSIAREDRLCRYCHKPTCIENPPDSLRCTACQSEWQVVKPSRRTYATPGVW